MELNKIESLWIEWSANLHSTRWIPYENICCEDLIPFGWIQSDTDWVKFNIEYLNFI